MADATVAEISQLILNKIKEVLEAPAGSYVNYQIGDKKVDKTAYLDWLMNQLDKLDAMLPAEIDSMALDLSRISPVSGADLVEYES